MSTPTQSAIRRAKERILAVVREELEEAIGPAQRIVATVSVEISLCPRHDVRLVEKISESPPESLQDILAQRIEKMGLETRIVSSLEQSPFWTVGLLARSSAERLLRLRNFGKTSLHKVTEKIAELGLELGAKPSLSRQEIAIYRQAPCEKLAFGYYNHEPDFDPQKTLGEISPDRFPKFVEQLAKHFGCSVPNLVSQIFVQT